MEQKTIAAHLGVSRTMVSFWANDREPISHSYLEILHELVFATLVENDKQAQLVGQLISAEIEAFLKTLSRDELRKRVTQHLNNWKDRFHQLPFKLDEELDRKHSYYFEQNRQLEDMRVALSNAASTLCEKVAAEYREVSDFIEPRPERPLHKMLRISRETRNSLKNGCRSMLTDLEQLDELLWFEEIFIRGEPFEVSNKQVPEEMKAQVTLKME
jgi:hypothetical protein